jgi:rhodanese-related sulfurtransferase
MRHRLPEVDASDVPSPLPADVVLLDVRETDEWSAGHIDGADHIPLRQLPGRLEEIPVDRRVLVVCHVGARSAQATAFLRAHGRDAVNIAGGMVAWERTGRPVVGGGADPRRHG